MKKKLSILCMIIFALVIFPKNVNATAVFKISCNPEKPQRGGDTACLVEMTQSDAPVSKINIKVDVLDMKLNGFTPNETSWVAGAADSQGFTPLTVKNTTGFTQGSIGNISATVNQDAYECGKICVTVIYSHVGSDDSHTYTMNNLGLPDNSCKSTPQPVESTPTPTPPDTGNFASYAILAGGAAIAMATISIARKRTKFYKV